jgi:hypothetical protein
LERVKRFSDLLPQKVLSGRGGRLALASVLSLATDPLDHPVYRWEPLDKAQKLLRYPAPDDGLDEAGLYEHSVEFFDRFLDEAGNRELKLRDRLDAQSLIWSVTKWSADAEPVSTWKKSDRVAFLKYRGEVTDEEPWWKPLKHPPGLEAELQQTYLRTQTTPLMPKNSLVKQTVIGQSFRRGLWKPRWTKRSSKNTAITYFPR